MKTIENTQMVTPRPSMTAPAKIERRYDIDWLRVIAVFSVIALHTSIIFSFGQFDVKHTQHTLTMDTIEIYIDIWVIPLLFVLAGAATKFALDRRTPKAYSSERVKRLLVPFIIWFVLLELKYLTILSLTILSTLLVYDLLVKRTNVTRFLFGMKPKRH